MASAPDASFLVEFTDAASGLKKGYTLSYWKADKSVSLFDHANKRTFLRRTVPTEAEPLTFELLRPGATVMVCGRPLKILSSTNSSGAATLVLIKAYANMADILDVICAAGNKIGRVQMLKLDAEDCAEFAGLNEHTATESCDALQAEYLLAVEVVGQDCIASVQQLCGPADPKSAAVVAPTSIR
jgi:hypothetical protein